MNWDLSVSWTRTTRTQSRSKNTNPKIKKKKKKNRERTRHQEIGLRRWKVCVLITERDLGFEQTFSPRLRFTLKAQKPI